MNKTNLGVSSPSMLGIAGICWRFGCLPGIPRLRLPFARTDTTPPFARCSSLATRPLPHGFNEAALLLPSTKDVWWAPNDWREPDEDALAEGQNLEAQGLRAAMAVSMSLSLSRSPSRNVDRCCNYPQAEICGRVRITHSVMARKAGSQEARVEMDRVRLQARQGVRRGGSESHQPSQAKPMLPLIPNYYELDFKVDRSWMVTFFPTTRIIPIMPPPHLTLPNNQRLP